MSEITGTPATTFIGSWNEPGWRGRQRIAVSSLLCHDISLMSSNQILLGIPQFLFAMLGMYVIVDQEIVH